MESVEIVTSSKSYKVYIGEGILEWLPSYLLNRTKVLIITDETINELHLNTLKKNLPNHIDVCVYTTPSGEKAKTFRVYEDCLSFALQQGLDRKSSILAFGGGAIGDLAGFVAATYMRGISFIQIPTTILAHDSAVGGKVAINHSLGKNMVGAFYQPEFVLYDTGFLVSLPERQIRSGFAEMVKHALIADPQFLQQLMNKVQSIDRLINKDLPLFLKRGIEIKAAFVSQDEKETGVRAYLNFGHTLGHALEAAAGYGTLTHGEAVMTGMIYSLLLSKKMLNLAFNVEEFINWIEMLGYDWKIPSNVEYDTILSLMKRDKKSVSQTPVFVLLNEIGSPISIQVEEILLKDTFYIIQS